MLEHSAVHLATLIAVVGLAACARDERCEVTLTCPVDATTERDGAPTPPVEAGDADDSADRNVARGADASIVSILPVDERPDVPVNLGERDAGDQDIVTVPVPHCSDETDCPLAAPFCDLALGRCVLCSAGDDWGCPAERPYCLAASDSEPIQCVQCEDASHCPAERPVCGGGSCVGCVTNDHCDPATPICVSGLCARCASDADCDPQSDTPVCRSDGRCVECLAGADCSAEAPACDPLGKCSGCVNADECVHLPETPYCDARGQCVQCQSQLSCNDPAASACVDGACSPCEEQIHCAHLAATLQCDTAQGLCIACLRNSDCQETSAARCFDSSCSPCTSDAHCTHLPGTLCDAGRCVQCTASNAQACTVGGDAYVCDALLRSCAEPVPDNLAGSASTCGPCRSDAHCSVGHACVQTTDDGELLPGWYCLWEAGAPDGPADCLDVPPYVAVRTDVTSIDGRAGLEVCGLASSTCEAL